MILQLLKQLWKQRRYNSLMIIEILFSFIALFSLSIVILHYAKRYNEPLGMAYKNVWNLSISQPWDISQEELLNDSIKDLRFDQIKKHIRNNFPEIINVSKVTNHSCPYLRSMSSTCEDYKGKNYCYNVSEAEPDFAATFNMKMVEGRWFEPQDELSDIKIVTINKKLKEELFGKEPAAGKVINVSKPQTYPIKIVGVFDAIKRQGEFAEEPNFMFNIGASKDHHFTRYEGLAIHITPNITNDFEARLIKDLMNFDKLFEYRIEKLEHLRKQYIMSELAPIIIIGAIVIFLVVNVMLGLFGTLWLNISRRRPEIGLRRAVGSSGRMVLWQILGETYGLTIISMMIGLIFTSQLFIFNIYATPVSTLVEANLAAFLIIIILCTISAYAPARLAAKLKPAEALHEE